MLVNRDEVAELFEGTGADSLDGVEVLDALEGTILDAVVDDPLGDRGAHAWEELELGGGGGVDVDLASRGGGLRRLAGDANRMRLGGRGRVLSRRGPDRARWGR